MRDETTPIPARLGRLIQTQEYVNFADLLPDNLELLRRMQAAAEQVQSSSPASDYDTANVGAVSCYFRQDSAAEALCPDTESDGVPAAGSARS